MIPDRQLERLTTVGKIPRIIQRLPQCIKEPLHKAAAMNVV